MTGLEPVAASLPFRGFDRLDRHAEPAELVLVALEHPAPGIVRLTAGIGGYVVDQLLERGGVVPSEQGGEEVDPALDLGHLELAREPFPSAYCIR
jgi:hypothetical protein